MNDLQKENDALRTQLTAARRRIADLLQKYELFKHQLLSEKQSEIEKYEQTIKILRETSSVFDTGICDSTVDQHGQLGDSSFENEVTAADVALARQSLASLKKETRR